MAKTRKRGRKLFKMQQLLDLLPIMGTRQHPPPMLAKGEPDGFQAPVRMVHFTKPERPDAGTLSASPALPDRHLKRASKAEERSKETEESTGKELKLRREKNTV